MDDWTRINKGRLSSAKKEPSVSFTVTLMKKNVKHKINTNDTFLGSLSCAVLLWPIKRAPSSIR